MIVVITMGPLVVLSSTFPLLLNDFERLLFYCTVYVFHIR